METIEKAKMLFNILNERKAVDPVLIEVTGITSIADYFIIASGSSTRQVQAITRHLEKRMREAGIKPLGIEGEQNAQWVLMDYGDVIIHIFYEDVRKFYDLEGLWVDAPRLEAKDLDQSTSLDKA
ncbi:MAG: ribosome silencing factor [Deltaproteobacteria bacterium CG17_big_fil_post_rev_8_21_14_2_50_51_6]|nr:MAG: ribosome silencing factor [Deltaproteobacteria bacterium CG17_big_fil_post_rev_8_21_14_2_50_51_6]